jgi:hypothetical protein
MPADAGGEDPRAYMAKATWSRVLRETSIPFHGSASDAWYQGVALTPLLKDVQTPADARNSLKDACSALERMKIVAPDPAAQRKYVHTIKFLQESMRLWPASLG